MSWAAEPAWLESPLAPAFTPMLGRQAELDLLLGLLASGTRLITITGPGGVGKTRLAQHLADTLAAEFERDVVVVPLAAIQDHTLVVPSIAQALEIEADLPDNLDHEVVMTLRQRGALLVLDNLEQVLEAAPVLADLLVRAPDATIVATSQAPLGIRGEQVVPLAPLPTPSPSQTAAEIMDSPAAALFLARARAVKPSFTVDDEGARIVAEICRRLDGLPLAIELAAARSTILSPKALLARLSNRLQVLGSEQRGAPDRLRTMRHAIAWSYDLLEPDAQALFRRLAVFNGSMSLEAVEAISRTIDEHADVYTLLTTLVDHSLLQTRSENGGDMRFLMLETLRDYALELLEEHGEREQAFHEHAAYVLALAESAEPALLGRSQPEWFDRLDAEWGTIRSAIEWAIASGNAEMALRIMGAIWRFCSVRAHISEGRAILDRALAAAPNAETTVCVRALLGAGYLAEDQRDLDVALTHFRRARALAGEAEDALLVSQAEIGLGTVEHDRGEYQSALTHHDEALRYARQAGNQRAIAVALGNQATVSYYTGDFETARKAWEECRFIFHTIGDVQAEALSFASLGALASEHGDFERARVFLTRAVELNRAANNQRDLSFALANLGEVWFKLGDLELAEEMFDESLTILRDQGEAQIMAMIDIMRARVRLARGLISAAASSILESTVTLEDSGDRYSLARCADVMAAICQRSGRPAIAVELLAAATALRQETGAALTPVDVEENDATATALRAAVPAAEIERLEAAGRGMDLPTLCRRITTAAREITGTPSAPPTPSETRAAVPNPLTAREQEVLRHLAEGASTKEIAEALYISPRTATTHVENILRKLDASSRAAAVAHALRNGLV